MALGSTQPVTEMNTRSISWGRGGRCVRLTTYHHTVPLSRNLGTLTSWNPLGLSRPVMGLIYIFLPYYYYYYYYYYKIDSFINPNDSDSRFLWSVVTFLSERKPHSKGHLANLHGHLPQNFSTKTQLSFFINYLHVFISNTECDHKEAVIMKDWYLQHTDHETILYFRKYFYSNNRFITTPHFNEAGDYSV